MTKPDDDVAREREAVQKLIGARGAMETALLRIHRLEQAISTMLVYNDEVAAGIGDGLFVQSVYRQLILSSEALLRLCHGFVFDADAGIFCMLQQGLFNDQAF